jgi:hypothetical protein
MLSCSICSGALIQKAIDNVLLLLLLLVLLQGELLPPVLLRAGATAGYVPLLLLGLGPGASLTTEEWGHNTYHVSMNELSD